MTHRACRDDVDASSRHPFYNSPYAQAQAPIAIKLQNGSEAGRFSFPRNVRHVGRFRGRLEAQHIENTDIAKKKQSDMSDVSVSLYFLPGRSRLSVSGLHRAAAFAAAGINAGMSVFGERNAFGGYIVIGHAYSAALDGQAAGQGGCGRA